MSAWGAPLRVAGVLTLAMASVAVVSPQTQERTPSAVLELFDFRRSAAVQAKLPRPLQEVSGLAVTTDLRLFAHGDERAVVAQIDACGGAVVKSFALGTALLRGDFEGIAIAGERFFLITSTGLLYEFREGVDGAAVPFTMVDTGFGKFCELEGLGYDPSDRVLLSGCKQSLRAELRGQITVLRWSLDRRAPAAPVSLTIPLNDVIKTSGAKGFHTTSIERDARSGHYVLAAGPERLLIEVTAKGAVIAARPLHKQLHSQPEGVTFVGDSLLVIADEGGMGRATVTCYHRAR